MPFASKAQANFMFANHPDIAKRWAGAYGVPKGLPKHVSKQAFHRLMPKANAKSESEEIQKPGVPKAPRIPGAKRDYGMLHPSTKARMGISKPADEKESSQEGPVEFVHGSRHRELGTPKHPSSKSSFRGRDVEVAHRKSIGRK